MKEQGLILDMESIISASQILSAETDLEQLLKQMMALVMANSGAEKAILLLRQDDGWFVQAKSDMTADIHDILLNQPFDAVDSESETDSVPETIFNYCHRSKEVLVVGNAQLDPRFAEDRTIQSHGTKSAACIPILSQGRLRAMLYLENRQMRDVFTIEQVEILKHLSTQFGVSVENALLYEHLAHKVNELRTSESRFRSVVENANETIIVAQDERIQYCNDQIGELSGYSPVEMRSMSFDEFIHPEDLEKVLREYESRLSGKSSQSQYSVRIITKAGQVKHVFVNSAVVDWHGRLATLAMISDITELKLAEEGLIKSEERFRSLMDQSPFPMELLTPDGKLSQVNPSWYQLWGADEVSAAEVIEKYNMITDPQLTKLGVTELVKKAFSGKHVILPPIIYDPDLTVTDFELENLEGLKSPWIQCHLYPIKDANGELEFVVNTYVDITDLRRAEQDIRESEKRFRSIMESSPLDIVIMTPDGKISEVNAAWKKSWGLSEEETAQVMANYNMITDKQIENLGLAPLVERAFKGENIILPPMDYSGNRTLEKIELGEIEAQERWIQTHMYSVKDDKGEIDYVVAINMDLTALKFAEREANEQREALARVDRATSMGQLTGSISHELNQPLTGILSNAQAVEMMLESGQWEKGEISEIMADIVADAKRAGDVIRNLRQLYREQRVEFLPVDINAIVEETTKLLQSEFIIQRVLLTTQLDSSLPWANGNRIQIQQVLVNLVMNASQAINDKASEDRRIDITTTLDAYEVKVNVEDNGSGIDSNMIEGIFEPLATWKPGHMGMGLAISNSIIKAHGGRMWAENRPEGGASVGFALPVPNKEDEV